MGLEPSSVALWGEEDSGGEGRKRDVLNARHGGTKDWPDEELREAPSWLCRMAYDTC